MTVPGWISIGVAFASFLTLVLTMLRHIVKYSYDKGVTDQRLTTVEAALKDSHDLRNVVASITPTLESLKESISRLDRALERNANRVFDANH